MNEHPILFSRKMVRAILAGKKSQTRRIVKQNPQGKVPFTDELPCPYGHTGDFLWVRETFAQYPDGFVFKADFPDDGFGSGIVNLKTGENYPLVWKPSIHMPRKASRLLLEITELRIERLNSISESDAIAESCTGENFDTPVNDFIWLWDSINAERGYSWASNPFVWVVSFQPARGLTKRAPDKWDSAASQAFSTPQPFSTPEMNLVPPTCG
jgi:hypothetical protein